MFDRSSTIVGLDIGTSKVCAVVAELTEAGDVSIVGLGNERPIADGLPRTGLWSDGVLA